MIDIYFESTDGDGEPTLWHAVDFDEGNAVPILRRCDIRASDRDYHWRKIVAAMETL